MFLDNLIVIIKKLTVKEVSSGWMKIGGVLLTSKLTACQ